MSNEQCIRDGHAGDLAIGVLQSRVWPDNARLMHKAVSAALCDAGFRVINEFFLREAFGTRNGRVDIVAILDGGFAAIELDTRRPRARSVAKLNQCDAFRIIGLRGVDCPPPKGIDAVVCMQVAA